MAFLTKDADSSTTLSIVVVVAAVHLTFFATISLYILRACWEDIKSIFQS